jgi:UDP-N-acetylmuramyl tripeptide synthase
VGLGGLAGALSRRLRAGDGTVVGGRLSLAVEPDALRLLAGGRRVALVSGTNGKTTTTRLLAAALAVSGEVVSNGGGSNMPAGLVSALSAAGGAELASLEVDEGYLPAVAEQVRPEVVVVLNLSRDQLDRNSEVRMVGRRWRSAFERLSSCAVVANADDPIVAWAAGAAPDVRWVAAGHPWRADAWGCPQCEGRICFGEGWSCPACGLRRPETCAWVEPGDAPAMGSAEGRPIPIRLALPGRFNLANAVMAAVAASAMGVPLEAALAAMSSTTEVGGRYEVVDVGGARVRLLLAKNPAGWTGMFDVLGEGSSPVVVAINARVADGRDPSWLWDVAFERLAGRLVVATGERRADLAVRLWYAGVEHVVVEDQVEALQRASAGVPAGAAVDYVGNYTAFQSLRRDLARAARRRETEGASVGAARA